MEVAFQAQLAHEPETDQSQADLLSQLMEHMAAQEELNALMAAPRISDAAAHVLKRAAGGEFYESPDSCRFLNLGAAHTSIRQLS